MTHGFPGISFLNTANRAMALLNIGISLLEFNYDVHLVHEFLMDEVIGNASSMKSVGAAVQEYDTDLPWAISVLERRFGRNVDVSASTSTDDPLTITEDRNDEEYIQETSDNVEIQEVVEVGHQNNIFGSTLTTISKRVRKFFPGIGCFGVNIDRIRQDNDGNIYEILFGDGNTEEWRQEKY